MTTEQTQPNNAPMCEGPYCGKCGKDLSGLTCCYVPGESSYCLEHAPKAQPNSELREKAREMFKCISCDGSGRVMATWNSENPGGCPVCKGLGVRPMTMDELQAFGASIQEEARQQIEELTIERDYAKANWERVGKKYKAAEKQLAEARAVYDDSGFKRDPAQAVTDLDRLKESNKRDAVTETRTQAFMEAAKIVRTEMIWTLTNWLYEKDTRKLLAAALERAAESKAQNVEAFEIHNRFCGENGEPCQVCRLKAEREEKK